MLIQVLSVKLHRITRGECDAALGGQTQPYLLAYLKAAPRFCSLQPEDRWPHLNVVKKSLPEKLPVDDRTVHDVLAGPRGQSDIFEANPDLYGSMRHP